MKNVDVSHIFGLVCATVTARSKLFERADREDGMGAVVSYDVVIIGGGVLGTAVAERLARTTASVCLIEAESDVGEHASKGNAGNALSHYSGPGLLQTELISKSNPLWEGICGALNVPYRRIGGLMIALNDTEAARLEQAQRDVLDCGVRVEARDGASARKMEPLINPATRAALWLPDEGIIDPMRLTVAYAQLAATNRAHVRLGERVTQIDRDDDDHAIVRTSQGAYRARFVINAAGVWAAEVSRMMGGEKFTAWPRKGQYAVLDRAFGHQLSSIVFCTQMPETKGTNVVPTTHGSVLLGPTAQDIDDPNDKSTDTETVAALVEQAARLVPAAREAYVIKRFAANRPAGDEQHRLRFDAKVRNLLHVTDRSSGVSTSPAAAELALSLLRDAGLDCEERTDATRALPKIGMLRKAADPAELVDSNPLYGQVVCACEYVSAAEIEAALAGPVPATSIDGVRKRTGAGYGRCQGSLCLAGISFMTALRTGTGPGDVRQTSRGTVGS